MSFVDASAIVAIINEEPGFEEIEKRLNDTNARFYITSLVRFEAVMAISRIHITAANGKIDRTKVIAAAREVVDDFIQALEAKEIAVDAAIGNRALDAAAEYGKVAGHPAALNFGDCFSYAAAKVHRLPLIYKGNDFAETDLA